VHVDAVLIVGLPLAVLAVVFFRATRREAAHQQARAESDRARP
jgi:hypothetical protein